MAQRKLYAGVKLRETRSRLGLTQKAFAEKLGVSLPYLNQMENNHRPVSTGVVLALAQEFGFDVTELSTGDAERIVTDMREALADPVFAEAVPPLADMRLVASNAPAFARAFLELHRAYRQSHERLASLDEALGRDDSAQRASPWEEVRDFFHYCDNYIDAVDRTAERFAGTDGGPSDLEARARQHRRVRGGEAEIGHRRGVFGKDRVGQRLAHVRDDAFGIARRKLGHVEPEFRRQRQHHRGRNRAVVVLHLIQIGQRDAELGREGLLRDPEAVAGFAQLYAGIELLGGHDPLREDLRSSL